MRAIIICMVGLLIWFQWERDIDSPSILEEAQNKFDLLRHEMFALPVKSSVEEQEKSKLTTNKSAKATDSQLIEQAENPESDLRTTVSVSTLIKADEEQVDVNEQDVSSPYEQMNAFTPRNVVEVGSGYPLSSTEAIYKEEMMTRWHILRQRILEVKRRSR